MQNGEKSRILFCQQRETSKPKKVQGPKHNTKKLNWAVNALGLKLSLKRENNNKNTDNYQGQ